MKTALAFLVYLSCYCIVPETLTAQSPKQIPGSEGQKTHPELALQSPLPDFQFIQADGQALTRKMLPKSKPVILALFNPGCDHCEHVMAEILKHYQYFKSASIVFVSFGANFNQLGSFIQKTGCGSFPNIYIAAGQDRFLTSLFMPNYILPQIMVFNPAHKLQQIYYEKIVADSVYTMMQRP